MESIIAKMISIKLESLELEKSDKEILILSSVNSTKQGLTIFKHPN